MKTLKFYVIIALLCFVAVSGQDYAYEEGRRDGIREVVREGRLEERVRDDERRLRRDEQQLRRDVRLLRREERRHYDGYGMTGW